MKFVHDADRCEGHGLCAQAAPQLAPVGVGQGHQLAHLE